MIRPVVGAVDASMANRGIPALEQMQPDETPVVMAVADAKVSGVPVVIDSLHRHAGFKHFVLICPPRVIPALAAVGRSGCRIEVLDENRVMEGVDIRAVTRHFPSDMPNHAEGAWYYQQFLKMAYARHAPGALYYLIWDPDTLLIRPMRLFERGRVLLTASREWHRDYFRTLRRILPEVREPQHSHISQHLLVYGEHMRALLDELDAHGTTWWQFVLASLTGKGAHRFSEYETYASYCLMRWPGHYRSIWRRWLRSGRAYFDREMSAADVSVLADLYDFVAFEEWDTGPKRQRRVRRRVARERLAVWVERRVGWKWFPK